MELWTAPAVAAASDSGVQQCYGAAPAGIWSAAAAGSQRVLCCNDLDLGLPLSFGRFSGSLHPESTYTMNVIHSCRGVLRAVRQRVRLRTVGDVLLLVRG